VSIASLRRIAIKIGAGKLIIGRGSDGLAPRYREWFPQDVVTDA